MLKRTYGWRRPKVDPRSYSYTGRLHEQAALPKATNNIIYHGPIYDQGQEGGCVGHSCIEILDFLGNKHKRQHPMLSRQMAYADARRIDPGTLPLTDSGSSLHAGLQGLVKWGVSPESVWPYTTADMDVVPTLKAYQAAAAYKVLKYEQLRTEQAMLSCMANGYGFIAGIDCFNGIDSDQAYETGVIPMPGPNEDPIGGHAIFLCDFDLTHWRYTFQNSWGPWGATINGVRGFGYLPMKYAEKYMSDCWAVYIDAGV